jgi:hypothetical protein
MMPNPSWAVAVAKNSAAKMRFNETVSFVASA